jgi:AraC-like DNA-binding protein
MVATSYGSCKGTCSTVGCEECLGVALGFGVSVVSCGLFISSGQGTHPDRILDNHELIVVRKGMLSIWEEDVRYDVSPEHALLLASGRRHRGASPFERDLSFYWIHFVVERVAQQERLSKQSDTIDIPKLTRVQRFDCVAELFHRYLDDQEAQRLTPLYSAALLVQILLEVSRPPLESPTTHRAVLVGRAEAYITQHMTEPLSTARIARALKTNPDYLNRAFREVHHMTMTEYIHRRRLTDACAMLRDTSDSIAEIAAACGYSTIGHFRRMFVRYRGVAPAAYRQLRARAYVNAR